MRGSSPFGLPRPKHRPRPPKITHPRAKRGEQNIMSGYACSSTMIRTVWSDGEGVGNYLRDISEDGISKTRNVSIGYGGKSR